MAFEAHPVTAERWPDLVELFDRPVARTCFCMYYRKTGEATGVGAVNRQADAGARRGGDRAGVDRLRGRRAGCVGLARAARGVPEAPPLTGDEAGRRAARVVDRLLLRGPRGARPRSRGADASGGSRLCAVARSPPPRGVPGRRARAARPGFDVLRRQVDVRPRRLPRGGPAPADQAGGAQGAPAGPHGET